MTAGADPLLRPDDGEAYQRALRLARQRTGAPMAFGALMSGQQLVLKEFLGTRSGLLDGLRVPPGRALGGYVAQRLHPFAVSDYMTATAITHDYDPQVLGEGIRAAAAAPVTVRGQARGVLYIAIREAVTVGDVVTAALDSISRRLATELAIRDEVDSRVRLLETAALVPAQGLLSRADLLDLQAELRSIAEEVPDQALRQRIRRACDRLAGLSPPSAGRYGGPPRLTPREIDVLNQVALGCSNAEAASRLSLRPETVKAYLRSASRKLQVTGRYQAVLAARGHGLLLS